MVFGFDDAVVLVIVVIAYNAYVPTGKKVVLEAIAWDVPAPDNLVTNTVTKSVKDGLVEGFFEIFNCYMALPWWWNVTTALIFGFIYFSYFEKQFWDLIRITKSILRNFMVICGWAVHGTMEIVQSMTVNTAAPSPGPAPAPDAAPTKKDRTRSPAPARSPPAPVPAPAPDAPAPAPAKKSRAKSPAPAKSPAHKESGIKVGKRVLTRHAAQGNSQYAVKVVSIDGDSCVIVWKDGDITDTLKQRKDLTLCSTKIYPPNLCV